MEYFFLFANPFVAPLIAEYRKKAGNLKTCFIGLFFSTILYLIVAFIEDYFNWKLLVLYIVMLLICVLSHIAIYDYGHIHLFGKRKEENKEKK